jgi:murein DD-endopeptidase MepM/ murein hydrolase activator NlpD
MRLKIIFLAAPIAWVLLCVATHAFQGTPKFLTLPFGDSDIKLQQGWVYMDGDPHNGIDYVKGTIDRSPTWQAFTACAAADGQARYLTGYNGGLGNHVEIKHAVGQETYFTLYCHLDSSPITTTGTQQVKRGEAIGVTGTTGDANGINHLHFEVHKGPVRGAKVDPYDIRSKRPDYPPNPGKVCGPNHLWLTDPPTLPNPNMPSPGSTTKIYVSESGNDESGDGSPDRPYRTVRKAVEVASSADPVVIYVRNGSYPGSLTIRGKRIDLKRWGDTGTAVIGR